MSSAGQSPPSSDGRLRRAIRGIPIVGSWLVRAKRGLDVRVRRMRFPGSAQYWDERYATGGTSGSGSYNRLAAFKAEILNEFVRDGAFGRSSNGAAATAISCSSRSTRSTLGWT